MDEGRLGEALGYPNAHPFPPFIVDSTPSYGRPYYELHFYERCGDGVLGMEQTEKRDDNSVRRCFNCGEPGHEVSSCAQRRDHALIALSRQMYNFYKEESLAGSQRLHEVEGWKRQRLAWLEEFEPGQVKGEVLRDALDLRNGDPGEYVEWLGNMATWGYPRGWIGTVDPRVRVWKMITGEDRQGKLDGSDEETLFTIAGEEQEELRLPSGTHALSTPCDDDKTSTSSSESAESLVDEVEGEGCDQPRRWATYPNTYFLSSKLFVYNGQDSPHVPDKPPCSAVSSTFDLDRQALWDRIVNGAPAPILPRGTPPPPPPLDPPPPPPLGPPPPPPTDPPPLPSTSPPPLPPTDPYALSTLLPMVASSASPSKTSSQVEDDDDSDMDLSDTG